MRPRSLERPDAARPARRSIQSLTLAVLLAVAAACGDGDGATAPPPEPDAGQVSGVQPEGPVLPPVPDQIPRFTPQGEGGATFVTPLVLAAEDLAVLEFPVRVVTADGAEREVATRAELEELLEGDPGGPEAVPEVAYVRLFYATDRAREIADWTLVARPLLPGVVGVLVALIVARFLRRALRVEARWAGRVASAALLLGALALLGRGLWLAVDLARVARATDVVYGTRRSASGALELGTVVVSIPAQRHEVARLERPSLLRGEIFPDPTRHFAIADVEVLGRTPYFEALRARVADSAAREACVFVHGYNNSFGEAALRLAQIAYDVGFDGAPILYSWPSKSAVSLYTHDRENADWSAGHLAGFLRDLEAETGAERVHLIAHSMGARVLSTALTLAVPEGADDSIFSELVLAAPDLDAETFEDFIAPALMARADRVTLYVSARDEALMASVRVNGQRRAGMAGEDLVIVPGMDTVDVSHVAAGHAYISQSGRVIGDLVEVLEHHRSAAERPALAPRERDGERYWELVRP